MFSLIVGLHSRVFFKINFSFIGINYIFLTCGAKYIYYLHAYSTNILKNFTTKLYYLYTVSVNNTYIIKTERFRAGGIGNLFNFYLVSLNINQRLYVNNKYAILQNELSSCQCFHQDSLRDSRIR